MANGRSVESLEAGSEGNPAAWVGSSTVVRWRSEEQKSYATGYFTSWGRSEQPSYMYLPPKTPQNRLLYSSTTMRITVLLFQSVCFFQPFPSRPKIFRNFIHAYFHPTSPRNARSQSTDWGKQWNNREKRRKEKKRITDKHLHAPRRYKKLKGKIQHNYRTKQYYSVSKMRFLRLSRPINVMIVQNFRVPRVLCVSTTPQILGW